MEMIRYNIRVSNMWRNVHKGFCLCYVCNCRHIWTLVHQWYECVQLYTYCIVVYVCTRAVHSYVHFQCGAAFAAIRI